jgi:hypothetical protein
MCTTRPLSPLQNRGLIRRGTYVDRFGYYFTILTKQEMVHPIAGILIHSRRYARIVKLILMQEHCHAHLVGGGSTAPLDGLYIPPIRLSSKSQFQKPHRHIHPHARCQPTRIVLRRFFGIPAPWQHGLREILRRCCQEGRFLRSLGPGQRLEQFTNTQSLLVTTAARTTAHLRRRTLLHYRQVGSAFGVAAHGDSVSVLGLGGRSGSIL